MRVAVIASGGGSAFKEVARSCPHITFHLVTDRPCEIEQKAAALGIGKTRIQGDSNELFSQRAAEWFAGQPAFDAVVMFYTRLVTSPLLGRVNLLNIHPSLLPAFRGIGAIRQAHAVGAKFLGCTLHVADASIDAGRTIAQACFPIAKGMSLPTLERISFLQKTALFFLAIDLMERKQLRFSAGAPVIDDSSWTATDRLNPALTNAAYLAAMSRIQDEVGIRCL